MLCQTVRPRAFALASLLFVLAVNAHAQTGAGAAVVPSDVQKTMEQVGDLDLLVALTPLHLTSDQVAKLLAPLKAISGEGETKRKKDYALVRALASDVAKARTELLSGKPLDPELETRINKTNADMEAQFASARQDSQRRVSDVLKEILTPEQNQAVTAQFAKANKGRITLPGSLRNSPDKAKDYLQNLARDWYADRILLPERSIDLLTKIKTYPVPAAPTPAAPAAPSPK